MHNAETVSSEDCLICALARKGNSNVFHVADSMKSENL